MYGTIARTRIKPENRERLREVMQRQAGQREVKGYVTSYMLYENDSDVAWLVAIFDDRETYEANADDPAQDADYREFRALMEEDPEWHDGEFQQDTR